MHFLIEARYRGAHLVVVSPDYNATAVHSDLWLNPKLQSDAALALAMAQVMITEGLCQQEHRELRPPRRH
jgi:nitrate reductase alpha subunit